MNWRRLWKEGLSKNRNSTQYYGNRIPPSKKVYFPLSVQLTVHNIAAEHRNLAPFRVSIRSSYHQIREITRWV